MAGPRARINHDVLAWARESAGLDVEVAAKKARVKPEQLESWEAGDAAPTMRQLRELGRVYKRPIAIFYLSERPRDFQPLRDYRRLPGQVADVQTPELLHEVRRAWARRDIALELLEELGEPAAPFRLRAGLDEEPDAVAARARRLLGVDLQTQASWPSAMDAFNHWRDAVEDAGALVLQMTDAPVAEIRGFSIGEARLPAIVVNQKDTPRGRTFTLMHELAHVALRAGGLCDLNDYTRRAPEELRTEVFCNQVAACILVPTQSILAQPALAESRGRRDWSDDEIEELSREYAVSREVIVRRLLTLGRTTNAFYQRKREEYRREYEENRKRQRQRLQDRPKDQQGGPSPATTAYGSAGPTFTRLVLRSYHSERITASDVSDYLGVRLKHLARIEGFAYGRAAH